MDKSQRLQNARKHELREPSDDDFLDLWQDLHYEDVDEKMTQDSSENQAAPDWYIKLEQSFWFNLLPKDDKHLVLSDGWLLDAVEEAITKHGIKREPEYIHRIEFLSLIRKILTSQCEAPRTILDPSCGYGDLLYIATSIFDVEEAHALAPSSSLASVALDVNTRGRCYIKQSHYSEENAILLDSYELIISDISSVDRKLGHCGCTLDAQGLYINFIEHTASRLSSNGVALLVVDLSFFGQNNERVRSFFRESCISIASIVQCGSHQAIDIPGDCCLLILKKGPQDSVFVGRMSEDPRHQDALVANMKAGRIKGDASLGRFCDLDDFVGFARINSQEALGRIAREKRLLRYTGLEVILDHEVIGPHNSFPKMPLGLDSVFISLLGTQRAELTIDSFDVRSTLVAHLKLDTRIVSAEYIYHLVNSTLYGDLWFNAIRVPSLFPRASMTQLLKTPIYLPSVENQNVWIKSIHHVNAIRAETDEIFGDLTRVCGDSDEIFDRINAINKEDTLVDWIDTLPFPLASVLWRYYASHSDDYRVRYEMLLDFFEVSAAFLAVIHLSAYMNNSDEWLMHSSRLARRLADSQVSIERASFGSWRIVAEYLGGLSAKALKKSAQSTCFSADVAALYGTQDRRIVEMLSSGKIFRILQQANKIRNNWKGHSGAVSSQEARDVHDELKSLVDQMRSVFKRNWVGYNLVKPGKMAYSDGSYKVDCQLIMGVRSSPFKELIINSVAPMVAGSLYLYDDTSCASLRLAPLMDVLPSPEQETTACFIFNRTEKEGHRWISYHFDKRSEIKYSPSGLSSLILQFSNPKK